MFATGGEGYCMGSINDGWWGIAGDGDRQEMEMEITRFWPPTAIASCLKSASTTSPRPFHPSSSFSSYSSSMSFKRQLSSLYSTLPLSPRRTFTAGAKQECSQFLPPWLNPPICLHFDVHAKCVCLCPVVPGLLPSLPLE